MLWMWAVTGTEAWAGDRLRMSVTHWWAKPEHSSSDVIWLPVFHGLVFHRAVHMAVDNTDIGVSCVLFVVFVCCYKSGVSMKFVQFIEE